MGSIAGIKNRSPNTYGQPRATGTSPPGSTYPFGIIWRPGAPASGNVFPSWDGPGGIQSVVDALQGAVEVFADASIAPCVLPPGTGTDTARRGSWPTMAETLRKHTTGIPVEPLARIQTIW